MGKEEGGNSSADNFMNKLKFNYFLKTKNQKIMNWLYTNFLHSTKSPHFPLRERVGQLIARGRECFVGLSILFSLWWRIRGGACPYLPICLPAEVGGGEGGATAADQLRPLPLLQADQVTRQQQQRPSPPHLQPIRDELTKFQPMRSEL